MCTTQNFEECGGTGCSNHGPMLLLCSAIVVVHERFRREFKAQVAKKWRIRICGYFVLYTRVLAVERAPRDLNEVFRFQGSNMLTKTTKRPSHAPCIVLQEGWCNGGANVHAKNYVACSLLGRLSSIIAIGAGP
jgi:hypothetical protein